MKDTVGAAAEVVQADEAADERDGEVRSGQVRWYGQAR